MSKFDLGQKSSFFFFKHQIAGEHFMAISLTGISNSLTVQKISPCLYCTNLSFILLHIVLQTNRNLNTFILRHFLESNTGFDILVLHIIATLRQYKRNSVPMCLQMMPGTHL